VKDVAEVQVSVLAGHKVHELVPKYLLAIHDDAVLAAVVHVAAPTAVHLVHVVAGEILE